jgi:two-component system sensor histidine kinase DegS
MNKSFFSRLYQPSIAVFSFASIAILIWAAIGSKEFFCKAPLQNCYSLPWDWIAALVSFAFWGAGIVAWYWKQPFLVVIFFLLSSVCLTVGFLSGYGIDLAGRWFYILLAWLSPILFQFHFVWITLPLNRLDKFLLKSFYLLAFIWTIPFAFYSIERLKILGMFATLRLGVRLTIALSMALIILFLGIRFHTLKQPTAQFRIRLVFSSIVLGVAPLLLLSLVPNLLGSAFIPFEINFAWLLFIPLAYAYSNTIRRRRKIERSMSQVIIYYLVSILFICGYLVIADTLTIIVPNWEGFWAWAIAGMAMVLLFLITRANQLVYRITNWILFGSEKSRLDLLAQVTDSLGLVLDRAKLKQILIEELATLLPTSGSILLLKNSNGILQIQGYNGDYVTQAPLGLSIPCNSQLFTFVKEQGPIVEDFRIRKGVLDWAALTVDEQKLLTAQDNGLWIALRSAEELHGLLILGCRPSGDLIDYIDHQVWQILAHQAGVAAHNVLLAEDIAISRNELAIAHQQLLYTSEQQRYQIACELHDNAVQQLLGVNMQIVALQQKIYRFHPKDAPSISVDMEFQSLRQEILRVTTQLREMIGELRPAGLEEFGLGSALEGFIHSLQRQMGQSLPQIEMQFEQGDQRIPDSVAICVFRVCQESLRNIIRHANASYINIKLSITEQELALDIIDNGLGFSVPKRLSELTKGKHFGLVGIAECISWVDGNLNIQSTPGHGTHIMVSVPLYKQKSKEKL